MLAVVAGEGDLPGLLLDQLDADAVPFRLCELDGYPSKHRASRPIIRFRIETLGSFIAELKSLGVQQVCFAGAVGRPPLDPAKIDAATMPLVPRMMTALQQGDDAALRTLLSFFKEEGIETLGIHELRTDLLPQPGVLGQVQPAPHHEKDADRGAQIIGAMAQADVGQSCIVAGGQALAIEAQPGTDFMLASMNLKVQPLPEGLANTLFNTIPTEWGGRQVGAGGVLVKAAKPGQELRIDMPTIGPDTIRRAAQVQLDGVVIEAGRVMVLDAPLCVKIADRAGLFLWVRA